MLKHFRCFKCSGKDDENIDLSENEYIKFGEPLINNFISRNDELIYSFFGQNWDESVWLYDIKQIFLLAEKFTKQLEQASRKNDTNQINYSQIRNQLCQFWLQARNFTLRYRDDDEYLEIIQDVTKEISRISSSLASLQNLPDYVLFNCGKNQLAPYNYLHLYLDLRWIMITFEKDIIGFEKEIVEIFTDLIYVGYKRFERFDRDQKVSPFLCSCFKGMWLLLQFLVDELHNRQFCKDFWSYFKTSLDRSVEFNCNKGKESMFHLWITLNIAKVQMYDRSGKYVGLKSSRIVSNFSLIEQCLKSALQSDINERESRALLEVIIEIKTKLWTADATFDLLQLLWEHYSRRINSSFVIASDTNPFVASCGLFNFASSVENITNSVLHTSYEMFLYLLIDSLKKNPLYWSKFKGRIYSKLSVPKLSTFSDIGIQNFVMLFLTLAHANFTELTEKLHSMLSQLPTERCDENSFIWSAHIVLLLMYVKQNLSIQSISKPLIISVGKASSDRRRQHLMQLYIEGLDIIIEAAMTLECDEHILFGHWLGSYLQWCPHTQVCVLLEIIQKLVDKLKISSMVNQDWHTVISSTLSPQIINLANSGTDLPLQIGQVAATIVSIDGKKYSGLVEQLTADGVSIEIVEQFLRRLLEKSDIHQITTHQNVLIQAWIKLSLLTVNQRNLYDVTQLITQLPQWNDTIGVLHVAKHEDSLYVLIKFAGIKVRNATTVAEIAMLKRWFETSFGQMDKWAMNVLSIADKSENNKLVLRVFMCGALLFAHCALALYTKNKTTSLFHRLVSTLLLPTTVLLNKRPSENVLAAVKMTWHTFMRGILRIDYRNDPYIERISKDFIIRYVPFLNDSTSPIIRCLDTELKDEDTRFILDKIASLITYKSRTVNEFAPHALNLLLEMIKSKSDTDVNKVRSFVEIVTPPLLEHLMFVENNSVRQTVLQILEMVKRSEHFLELRVVIKTSIMTVVDKYVAFYSTSTFQMLMTLTKVFKSEIEDVVDGVKDAVQKVERMRGVGYDKTLRKGLQDIQDMLKD